MPIDLGSVMSIGSSIGTAAEMAKSLLSARDEATFKMKASELIDTLMTAQNHALTAQAEHFTLMDQKRSLEAKIVEFEDWQRETERYALKDFGAETYAYALKPGMEQGEPPHCLCPNCYAKKHKSILQKIAQHGRRGVYQCHSCEKTYSLGQPYDPPRREGGSWMGA